MSRKRWRLQIEPRLIVKSYESKAAAYRGVQSLAADRACGMTKTQRVTVLVSEDKGPWQTYEHVDLDELRPGGES